MASYNKVLLMGNLTRDPELRVTPSGLSICKFSIAVNRVYTVEGERKEEVTFIDLDAFGKTAETISKYMSKGRPIFVEGRLKLDQWDDKTTGEKRSRLGVVVDNFQFLGSREGPGEAGAAATTNYEEVSPPARTVARPAARTTNSAPANRPAPRGGEQNVEDDVPF